MINDRKKMIENDNDGPPDLTRKKVKKLNCEAFVIN